MKKIIVSPSILDVKKSDLDYCLNEIKVAGADWVHIDVMDGKFVPNISYNFDDIRYISLKTNLIKDVHIMINNPSELAEEYLNSGAEILTFHYEACSSIEEAKNIIDLIHLKGKKAGISIKPKTKVEQILPILKDLDLVLVMSVEPGLGGQKFMDSALDKISQLRKEITENKYNFYIQVDGGINKETGKKCVDAGADVLVAGHYIFGGDDIIERVESLTSL